MPILTYELRRGYCDSLESIRELNLVGPSLTLARRDPRSVEAFDMLKVNMSNRKMIQVIGREEAEDRSFSDQLHVVRGKISVTKLERQLHEFIHLMGTAVAKVPNELGAFTLDTITLTAEISSKGQISLLGTGGEIGSKGGLTLTLKRTASKPETDRS